MLKRLEIDPEFKNLIPQLSPDVYRQLEENLVAEGCLNELIIWEDVIIDGHNRYEICHKHEIPFKTKEMFFDERDEVIIWMLKHQLGTRTLENIERVKMAVQLKEVVATRAKGNQRGFKGNQYTSGKNQVLGKDQTPVNTNKELGKIAGVSDEYIRMYEVIQKKGSDDVKKKVDAKEMTVNKAFLEIKQKEKQAGHKITCTDCGKLKPASEFTYDNNNKEYKTKCKKCALEVAKMKFDLEKPIEKMDEIDLLYLEMKKPELAQQVTGNKEKLINPIITDFKELLKGFNKNINRFVYMDFKTFGLDDPTELEAIIEENLEELSKIKNNLKELNNEKAV